MLSQLAGSGSLLRVAGSNCWKMRMALRRRCPTAQLMSDQFSGMHLACHQKVFLELQEQLLGKRPPWEDGVL